MPLSDSELILNSDGSIYHLNLLPEDLADTIITVGDPERVAEVTKYFDKIELSKQSREFATQTGLLGKKRITVISTGIGTDNVDIVLNELDALTNVDFKTRSVKEKTTSLTIIRIGTSGAVLPEIPVDSFLISAYAIGLDGLMHFYQSEDLQNKGLNQTFSSHLGLQGSNIVPYSFEMAPELKKVFDKNRIRFGITVTNAGFYAPQSRKLRGAPQFDRFLPKLSSFEYNEHKLTNLEMETAGIYGLSKLLGHKAVSLNALLANRSTGEFSKKPSETIDELIRFCLEQISA